MSSDGRQWASEIEEEASEVGADGGGLVAEEAEAEEGSLFSFDFRKADDVVYVAVGKSENSMDALIWTLRHAVNPTTLVFLIHVFPETRLIPTPLGKLPVSQVNPEQKENYMNQERSKRREFLQKFLDKCSTYKAKVDTVLIESDLEAKAILDLIPILNIRKLVLGASKPNSRKSRSRRASGTAEQILQGAPEFCEVKIICEGKEVADQTMGTLSSRSSNHSPKSKPQEHQNVDTFSCSGCFGRKVAT